VTSTPGLEVADGELVLQAVSWYADQHVDFIDAYNAAWVLAQKLPTVCTFDCKHFSRLEGVTVRVPGQDAL
jgi:hypothetical protein